MESVYEKLGVFYLGARKHATGGAGGTGGTGGTGATAATGATDHRDLVLYDSKDLTTHAVCVGMTGSGKTGLCAVLLEEAAIDGIPAICIDPKGDLANLALTFPGLSAEEFRPWVDEGDASRAGLSVDDFARVTADKWRAGLASWSQDAARIARLRAAADVAIYTPGSSAGLPLSVLRTLRAPGAGGDGGNGGDAAGDADALRERVQSTVTGLLALLGIDADPLRSREHVLLSNIVHRAWTDGLDVSLADLIAAIQRPPFEQVGVLDVESFFPAKDRFTLAMALNNLLASPGFAAWTEGDALDVQRLLWTPAGKPRLAIVSIAHLSDAERMFFVTLLLNEVVAWMRRQSGTSSLRALLYMDEVAGYLPPVANPPSKAPMLTLLKQARAFGLGVVVATQNPVDIDYKALANAGTWFLGRLQTERDKLRVLDGLAGASAASGRAFDRDAADRLLSSLASRTFLLHSVHEDAPCVFESRWALSYLRGPLTRPQIRALTQTKPAAAPAPADSPAAQPAFTPPPPTSWSPPPASPGAPATWGTNAAPLPFGAAFAAPSDDKSGAAFGTAPGAPQAAAPQPASSVGDGGPRPVLPPGVPQGFLSLRDAAPPPGPRVLRPALLGLARTRFSSANPPVEHWRRDVILAEIGEDPSAIWEGATRLDPEKAQIAQDVPAAGAVTRFAPVPSSAAQPRFYAGWARDLAAWLFREGGMTLTVCEAAALAARPGESEGDFLVRVRLALRERRDAEIAKLRQRFAPRVASIESRIRTAKDRVDREASQAKHAKLQSAIGIGGAILSFLGGGRRSVSSAARGTLRAAQQGEDVDRAEAGLDELERQRAALTAEIEAAVAALHAQFDDARPVLATTEVRPRRSDIMVERVLLVWR